jgi:prepilin-type N-terminal cleavage/methylation domain-containing protein
MRSTLRGTRTAFTLIELLVVIAIIAILVAMLLPAVQQVREAARKSQCQDHLHNIGLALHNYESSYKRFPQGFIDRYPGNGTAGDSGWSWMAMILPQLEQKPLYDQIDFNFRPYSKSGGWGTVSTQGNTQAMRTPLDIFSCPSDTKPETRPLNAGSANGTNAAAITSYCGSMGAFDGLPAKENTSANKVNTPKRNNGWLVVNECRRFAQVTDGSSNVFLVGEVSWIPRKSGNGSDRQFIYGNITTGGGPNAKHRGSNQNGPFLHLRCTRQKLNGPVIGGGVHHAFHSNHPGGGQFCMGDAKVVFISENIDHTNTNVGAGAANLNGPYGLYQRLAGIDDGQPLGRF